jgi:hypothetical protein
LANIILTETAAFVSRMENIISKKMAEYLTYHTRMNCEKYTNQMLSVSANECFKS